MTSDPTRDLLAMLELGEDSLGCGVGKSEGLSQTVCHCLEGLGQLATAISKEACATMVGSN